MGVVFGVTHVPAPRGIRRGRRVAERLMRDSCIISRPTGETTTDPDTFVVVPVYDTVYAGRMKMQTYEGHEQTFEAAGATQVVQRSTVHVPVGAFRSRPGDIVTVTASVDPLLVGKSFRVVQDYPVKTHATAYRIFVDENVGEEVPEWQP